MSRSMWHIAQLLIMGAVVALLMPVMPGGNAVAAGLLGWFVALLVTGLTARALWWLQDRRCSPRSGPGQRRTRLLPRHEDTGRI
jgi:hypothetical protein